MASPGAVMNKTSAEEVSTHALFAARNDGFVSRYGPDGTPMGSFSTGVVAAEQLSIDSSSNLYIADWGAYPLRKFAPSGTVLWTLGSSVPGYSFGPIRHHGVTVAADGTFKLANVPPDKFEVVAWMPASAAAPKTVEVKTGAAAQVVFELAAPKPQHDHLNKDNMPYGRYK